MQKSLWSGRTVVWFSCGAASAVAAKLVCEQAPDALVVYHDLSESEHPDNVRFFADVQRWIGKEITRTHHDKFSSVDEMFEAHRSFQVFHAGAECTRTFKRREAAKLLDWHDRQVLGMTADERSRIALFEKHEPLLRMWWILRDEGITKDDCLRIIAEAGIAIPEMYRLGFDHNNCLGCVKSRGKRYWNMIRQHFPEVFQRRAEQERRFGFSLIPGVYLDELPSGDITGPREQIECGTFCSPEPLSGT